MLVSKQTIFPAKDVFYNIVGVLEVPRTLSMVANTFCSYWLIIFTEFLEIFCDPRLLYFQRCKRSTLLLGK